MSILPKVWPGLKTRKSLRSVEAPSWPQEVWRPFSTCFYCSQLNRAHVQRMKRRCLKALRTPRSPMASSLLKTTGRCLRRPKIWLSGEGLTPLLGQVHERVKLDLTNKVCTASCDNLHFFDLRALHIQPIRQHRRFNFWYPCQLCVVISDCQG